MAVGRVGREHPGEQLQPLPGVDRVVEPDDEVVAQPDEGRAAELGPGEARGAGAGQGVRRRQCHGRRLGAPRPPTPAPAGICGHATPLWTRPRCRDHRRVAGRHAEGQPRGHDHGGDPEGRCPRVASDGVSSLFDPPVDEAGAPPVDPGAPLAVRMRPRVAGRGRRPAAPARARGAAAPAGRGRRADVAGPLRPARHRQDDAGARHLAGHQAAVRRSCPRSTPG